MSVTDYLIPLSLGALAGAAIAFVILAWSIRRTGAKPVTDVDELAVEVERLGKVFRRLNMQRVRSHSADPADLVPNPQPALPLEAAPVSIKDQLRARVFPGGRP